MREESENRSRVPWFVGFLGRRLIWAFLTLFIYLSVVFLFVQVWVPFNWATPALLGGPEAYQAALESLGLDRPLWERYVEFATGLVQGELGQSFTGAPVVEVLKDTAPVTIFVFAVGALIAYIVGEFLGRVGGWRRGAVAGFSLSTLGVISATIFPPFLVFVAGYFLRDPLLELRSVMGLPNDSLAIWVDAAVEPAEVLLLMAVSLFGAVLAALLLRSYAHRHRLSWLAWLALPVCLAAAAVGIALAGVGTEALDVLYRIDYTTAVATGSPLLVLIGVVLISFGQVLFMMRVGIEDERHEDYVLTARAKGLRETEVRDRHVVRNALAPSLAGSFLAVPTLLAGMIIIELQLEVQGLSSAFFGAVESQDIPLLMGVLVVLGLIGIGLRLITDLAIASLDPRQRRGEL